MTREVKRFLLDLSVCFSILLDGQISSLFAAYLPFNFHITCHLLLISVQILSFVYSKQHLILLFTLAGFLYDVYYLQIVGVATLTLPVMALVLRKYNSFLLGNPFTQAVTTAVMILFLDSVSYLISSLLHGISLSFPLFVVYGLAPTMLFNAFLSPLLQRWFERITI